MSKKLFGYNKKGEAVYSTDVESNPFWFESMSSFTDIGREVATALQQMVNDGQVNVPFEEIVRSDKEALGLIH